MKHIVKLYNTWEKAKDIFVKPSLKVYFGKWRNDPNLPVWRRGPHIFFMGRKYNNKKAYMVRDSVMIYTGTVPYKFGDKTYESKCYNWVPKHTLPGKLKAGDYVWSRNIRKKLKKWHLSWIPPIVNLPIWMRFHIVNLDLGWKTKWDDVRYEFPPQFSIIAFGFSLTFTLHSPIQNEFACDDHYWEAILNHIYMNKAGDLERTILLSGIWSKYNKKDEEIKFFALRPEYIKPSKLNEYYAATSDIKRKKEDYII